MATAELKPITIAPLTGLLDDRSNPDQMPVGSFRKVQNFWSPAKNKLSRRPGWEKLLSQTTYNNTDLHDQLLALQTYQETLPEGSCASTILTRDTGRQPISLLFQATSSTGHRRLLAGTESRLYCLNEHIGNYKLIADGLGRGTDDGTNPRHRFYAAQAMDMVIFTNNYDKPFAWLFEQATSGCLQRATTEITELDLIGLTKAAHVWVWKDVVFFADVEMDGQRYRQRIVWGDYQQPLSFDPSLPESIAGSQDLEYGEQILGGMEIGNLFLIYTNKRIWQMEAVGGEQVFAFSKRYTPSNKDTREGCLTYRNTLVSIGSSHVYWGKDGVYEYDLYATEPKRIDWIFIGTKDVFDNVNPDACDQHVGYYNEITKEIWWSWVGQGSLTNLPTKTLVVNKEFQHVSTVDYGFTAFCIYQNDPIETVRDFIIQNCICTPAEMQAAGYGFVKEGLPLTDEAPADCVGITCIYTTQTVNIDGQLVEDWTQALTSSGSLCEKLGDSVLEDDCAQCESQNIFVMASAVDWCLKQSSSVGYRERCTNPTATGTTVAQGYQSSTGTYALDGYESILTGAPNHFGSPKLLKQLDRFDLEASPVFQLVPSTINLRDGGSEQIVDTNSENCTIMWTTEDSKLLECLADSMASHTAEGTRPASTFAWPCYTIGKYIYWELSISGTGGACDFSSVTLFVKPAA